MSEYVAGLVRGSCVFAGAVTGVFMVIRPEFMLPTVVVTMLLASIAANYRGVPA